MSRTASKRFRIDPTRDLWDRQPGEGDEAWEAFVTYRDSGLEDGARRSTRRTARELDKSHTLIGQWSGNYEWQLRTQAFDRNLDAIKLKESADRIVRAARRHGDHIEALTLALIAPVRAYLTKIQQQGGSAQAFEGWTLRELQRAASESARLMPNLIQAERLVMGLATDKHEVVDERAAAQKRFSEAPMDEVNAFLLGALSAEQLSKERDRG
jgi:hypothetical protein